MVGSKAGQKKRAIRRRQPAKAEGVVSPKPTAATTAWPTADVAPVRGVKLRTVSLFTVVFALMCLGAFMAGRPPASAEAVRARHASNAGASAERLRHDDARSLLRRDHSRERKAGSQEFEKSP